MSGALAQRAQLLPGHRGIDLAVAGEGAEAAIRAGHDALLADDVGEPFDALRDEFRVFDVIGAGVDQSRREYFILGNPRRGPDLPLVFMPRIGGLEQNGRRPRSQDDPYHPLQRYVVVVGTLVVSPANVHAHLLRRNGRSRCVERLDVGFRNFEEFRFARILISGVPRHGEIGTIELQLEAAGSDGGVFGPHGTDQVRQVGFVVWIIRIRLKRRDETRRGRIHEALHAAAPHRLLEPANVVAAGIEVNELHRPHAARAHELLIAHDRGELLSQLRQRRKIKRGLARDVAAKAGQALLDIGRVSDLAELAVADHRYARLDLSGHGILHRRLNLLIEFGHVIRLAVISRKEQRNQLIAPGQTADVGRGNARHRSRQFALFSR